MSSRRLKRMAQLIRQEVSRIILYELKDPRLGFITVTGVEVSADLQRAKVLVSVMGEPGQISSTMRGLASARGFIQAEVAERLSSKFTPVIHFQLDESIKRSVRISSILRELHEEKQEPKREEDEVESGEADSSAQETAQ